MREGGGGGGGGVGREVSKTKFHNLNCYAKVHNPPGPVFLYI